MQLSGTTHQDAAPAAHVQANDQTESRKTIYFSGRVQGVGFRYTARNIAQQYRVKGYVRNLDDGRVELVMEGAESETRAVVEELKRKMTGFIRNVTIDTSPANGEFEEFSIRH